MRTVYISIGNSDDKLSQAEWSAYAAQIAAEVHRRAFRVHGEWYSLPNARWQNACWCVEAEPGPMDYLKQLLTRIREDYRQDSIAWAVAKTDLI